MHTVVDKIMSIHKYVLYWCAWLYSIGDKYYSILIVSIKYFQKYFEEFKDFVLNATSNKINDVTTTDTEIDWTGSLSETRSENEVGQNSKHIGQLSV